MKTVLFNTHDIVLIITIYQCVLFAFFLLSFKKGNKHNNVLLALFLLSYAAIPLDTLINYGEAFRGYIINVSPNMFKVFGYAYWLEAVLLLFYVRSLIYKEFVFKKYDFLLFAPLLIYITYEINTWYLLDSATKVASLNNFHPADEPMQSRFIGLFRECFRLFCGILCLIELQRYQKKIKDCFADIETVSLTWLKILVIGFLFIRTDAIFVSLAMFSSFEFDLIINYEVLGLISNYTVLLLISVLIFFSLRHSSVFKGIEHPREQASTKVEKAPLDHEIIDKILAFMKTQKPYLNHLLTLENLANQLGIPPRYLSQVINRDFEKNFFEFINSYRVEESKQLLEMSENSKETMLKIMEQSGFNSKATFNTFFKKTLGLTPTQYRKEYLKAQQEAA
ncbi:AraC family transcriptional regulator [Shewanella sp. UCD-KL12]|uniref:helix-turn-helix domain-containing protein n=1 Tax=Shewanella sp. UCD-KL12 TaxID=1917163 RepID=UPI000970CDC3|nr:helix-turn-helix domain-containing protein [Shewanella sp. UCD-KL12]